MKLQITALPDTNVLHLMGDLDLYSVATAREALLNHLADRPGLTLDLVDVETCDTAGMQLLLAARRSAMAFGGAFSIQTPAPAIEKCGALLGLPPEQWQSHAD
jgi:anti-sigma B factor antagonist